MYLNERVKRFVFCKKCAIGIFTATYLLTYLLRLASLLPNLRKLLGLDIFFGTEVEVVTIDYFELNFA